MIVVDTSALTAVFEDEPERQQFSSIIANADRRLVSTVTLLEAGMVARGRRGASQASPRCRPSSSKPRSRLSRSILDGHLALALDAFERYGKGLNPAARLNLGDCCSYALAKSLGAPLLFKGNDFVHTDIVAAA